MISLNSNLVQHKWDGTGISNIASGSIYANLEVGRLRMSLAHDEIIASSLFDYSRPNPDGTVMNFMWVLMPLWVVEKQKEMEFIFCKKFQRNTLTPTTASKGTCTLYPLQYNTRLPFVKTKYFDWKWIKVWGFSLGTTFSTLVESLQISRMLVEFIKRSRNNCCGFVYVGRQSWFALILLHIPWLWIFVFIGISSVFVREIKL